MTKNMIALAKCHSYSISQALSRYLVTNYYSLGCVRILLISMVMSTTENSPS